MLTPEQIAQLNDCVHKDFEAVVGEFTPAQIAEYLDLPEQDADFLPTLWGRCVSWAFESMWAGLSKMTTEELATLKQAAIDNGETVTIFEIPDNLTPDKPLKDHILWSPHDHAHERLYR